MLAQDSIPELAPIASPVSIFPYPLWMVLCAVAVALFLIVLLAWQVIHAWKNRPKTPPPTPREIALAALEKLRVQLHAWEPYAMSIALADVLRSFITNAFGVAATVQTSPEFLATVANSGKFSTTEKELLAAFLEKADLIKFARVEATARESEMLLNQAYDFVKGATL